MNTPIVENLNGLEVEPLLLATAKAIDSNDPKFSLEDILPVLRRRFATMSVAELLKAFLATWRCDPHILNPKEIFSFLRKISKHDFPDDIDAWMVWFLALPEQQLKEDQYWLTVQYRIYRSEHKRHKKPDAEPYS